MQAATNDLQQRQTRSVKEVKSSEKVSVRSRRGITAALINILRTIPRNDPRCVAICARHVYILRRAHLMSPYFRYTFRRRFAPHYLACRNLCTGNLASSYSLTYSLSLYGSNHVQPSMFLYSYRTCATSSTTSSSSSSTTTSPSTASCSSCT